MKILHVASEVAPYSQSGGLAQVAGALPAALRRMGHESFTFSPAYPSTARFDLTDTGVASEVTFGSQTFAARILADGDALFVDCPVLYDRPGLYTDDRNNSYGDNAVRFALLCKLAADHGDELVGGGLDVIHAHDWQAGLVAAYAKAAGLSARIVFTIHNLAFRGIFGKHMVDELGLDWSMFNVDGFEFYDQLSFLKAGAAYADAITTVSPTYAEEIKTPEQGHGLDGFFRNNQDRLSGILNGIDLDVWNPSADGAIASAFDSGDLGGKKDCRRQLCESMGIEVADETLLCGVVSRLSQQKGPEKLADLVGKLPELGAALVVLGSGDPGIEDQFRHLAGESAHFAAFIGFDSNLAHQVFAGCDAFLMPSRFEPCGLGQLTAMRYGTIPIVHAVGGLADTVDETTGFSFGDLDGGGLEREVGRAAAMFRDAPASWAKLISAAMAADWSWDRAAARYVELYRPVG